jgi:hypothetical protein
MVSRSSSYPAALEPYAFFLADDSSRFARKSSWALRAYECFPLQPGWLQGHCDPDDDVAFLQLSEQNSFPAMTLQLHVG